MRDSGPVDRMVAPSRGRRGLGDVTVSGKQEMKV